MSFGERYRFTRSRKRRADSVEWTLFEGQQKHPKLHGTVVAMEENETSRINKGNRSRTARGQQEQAGA